MGWDRGTVGPGRVAVARPGVRATWQLGKGWGQNGAGRVPRVGGGRTAWQRGGAGTGTGRRHRPSVTRPSLISHRFAV